MNEAENFVRYLIRSVSGQTRACPRNHQGLIGKRSSKQLKSVTHDRGHGVKVKIRDCLKTKYKVKHKSAATGLNRKMRKITPLYNDKLNNRIKDVWISNGIFMKFRRSLKIYAIFYKQKIFNYFESILNSHLREIRRFQIRALSEIRWLFRNRN